MKKYLLGILFGIVLTSTMVSNTVMADAADTYCRAHYSSSTSPEYKACTAGYNRGDNTQGRRICSVEFAFPVPVGDGSYIQPNVLQDACVNGWLQWRKDIANCRATHASDQSKAEECISSLRPGDPAPSADAPPVGGDPTAPGPPPASADIKTLDSGTDTKHVECGLEGFFGELVCIATKTMARISDASFSLVSIFLKTPPIISVDSSGQESALYRAWAQMRNLANIAFVLAFIIVIYSQLTGMGVSNHNIKKILPRMIISALLINISFYLCALFVDLSNLLGATLTNFLSDILPPESNSSNLDSFESIVGASLLVGGAVIAGGAAAVFVSASMLIPILISVVIAIVTTVVILVLRQALIITFIVIAPLAMAAIILPGTKKWFDKWSSAFIPLVMLYPAIALVYGGSQIASDIIRRVGANEGELMMTIFALGIQIIPLLLTPALMKLGGGLMNRYAGVAKDNAVTGAVRKKGDAYAKYRGDLRRTKVLDRPNSTKTQRGVAALMKPRDAAVKRGLDRDSRRDAIDKIGKGPAEDYAIDAVNDTSTGVGESLKEGLSGGAYTAKNKGEKYQEQLAQSKDSGLKGAAKAHAIKQKLKMHSDKVKAKMLDLERNGVSGDRLTQIGEHGTDGDRGEVSAVEREAAILRIAKMGDAAGLLAVAKNSDTLTPSQARTFIDNSQSSGTIAKMPFLANPTAMDNIRQGTVNANNFTSQVVAPAIAEGDLSAEDLTTLDGKAAEEVVLAAEYAENHVEPDNIEGEKEEDRKARLEYDAKLKQGAKDLRAAAYVALTEQRVNANITGARDPLHKLAKDTLHESAIVQNSLHDMGNRSSEDDI